MPDTDVALDAVNRGAILRRAAQAGTSTTSPLRATVSGRYRGRRDGFEVELRIDVDGHRPLRRMSADYYRVADGELLGSMRVDEVKLRRTAAGSCIVGLGRFTWEPERRRVEVSIPNPLGNGARCAVTLRHFGAGGAPGRSYVCAFASTSFRTATLEEACERGVERFESYDTRRLPSLGPARRLSTQAAFAEAGIELVCSEEPPMLVDTALAGPDLTWSDAELHAAMEQCFSRYDDRAQWAIWMLHAAAHDDRRLCGLMFDRRGRHRQGCAVFYGAITETGAARDRRALHTCVHELGHGFNLPHCWQSVRSTPPVPERPDAASWMNYPQRYPQGEQAYWAQFPFRFDDLELAHLRHAFQEDVIMGGRPFAGGSRRAAAAIEPSPDERCTDALRLRVSARPQYPLGMPVTIAIDLAATTRHCQQVPPILGPRVGNTEVAIRRPDGSEFVFVPLLQHCRGWEPVGLKAGDRPIRDYAFVHYGKDGFAFDRPGVYRLRARFTTLDGARVWSNVLAIRVLAPVTRADHQIQRMIGGDHGVGTLMSLIGSDAPELSGSNETLQDIIDGYPSHPMAGIARVVRATNAAREFKLMQPDGRVRSRKADHERARELIGPVIDMRSVDRAIGADGDATTRDRSLAQALTSVGTLPGVPPGVRSFISSRRLEIAKVIPGLPLTHAH